ncbi:MAG: isoleucine--tRNA ligase [Pirellulales bacterium]
MFAEVSPSVSFPQQELEILKFWRDRQIYHRSLEQRAGQKSFVFFEGPPTANGLPHPGHCLTRAIKDVFPRYQTMRGAYCLRRAGWDTHGLPVEVEVCKELGIHSKEEIEAFGIEAFIHKCQQSVWRYMQQWEQLTERLGFWVDLPSAYVTYHQSYVESVWWCLKELFQRGLLYQGHKIVWWWAQGGTALSSGEVGQGYREVADPSVYVRFPLLDEAGKESDISLLVWTTTPWTLPSNQFAAVHPDLMYATVVDAELGQKYVIAEDLVAVIGEKVKRELQVESVCRGSDLLGRRYRPPFDYYYATQGQLQGELRDGGRQHRAWRVVPADFVTTSSGTGVVHQAPAFGEVDYDVLVAERARFVEGQGPDLICAVGPDGKFTSEAPEYAGRWVKETDRDISRQLRSVGLLLHQEQYLHEYPFCWRADQDPLIQYPRKSWFIRTTQFRDQMLENNRQIQWLPEHIRDGRFGNFLESNVDWALSRERYWGTPLPIWVCSVTGRMEAISSYDELLAKPGVRGAEVWQQAKKAHPELPDDLSVHKPYIDAVTYDSPFAADGRMERVSEVIDCWFDSGAMPFAQWGYPHRGQKEFAQQFPADFISEAIDQTRGWFYSLLAISTMMFPPESGAGSPSVAAPADAGLATEYPHPYRTCIVLGLMLGEDGQKMSKSRRNYREPQEIFDRYGADALRWYFFANQPPWTSIRYNEQAIKDSIPEFLLRMWNVFAFFANYAHSDGFNPAAGTTGPVGHLDHAQLARLSGYRPHQNRAEIDRWILSELHRTCGRVVASMDAFDNYAACQSLNEFVDGLSNWYVRRCRDRFWGEDKADPDKLDAYWTLYESLLTLSKLVAPFVPFVAEAMWRHLTSVFGDRATESVHLTDYPTGDSSLVDWRLSEQMAIAREISSLGRSARMAEKLKVRQPLAKVEVILGSDQHLRWLQDHADLVSSELNVKQVEYTQHSEEYITYQVQPNFKVLGPKLGPLLPAVKQWLGGADGGSLLQQLKRDGKIVAEIKGQQVELSDADIQIRLQAKPGWAAAPGEHAVVVLSTELTPELIHEGLARDLVRLIQDRRKEMGLHYTDRIRVQVATDAEPLQAAIAGFRDYIAEETLAVELSVAADVGNDGLTREVGSHALTMSIALAGK